MTRIIMGVLLFVLGCVIIGINQASSGDMSVIGGSLNIENAGEGKILIYLGTERHWQLRQLDTGSNSALELASVGGNGNKNFVITTNGAVIIQPKDTDFSSTLMVKGNLEVTGEINGKCKFPPPDYDSGWHWIERGQSKIFTHNLGGNPDDYVVDLTFDQAGGGAIHNKYYGGTLGGLSEGGNWSELNDQNIRVYRFTQDVHCIRFRVRIWVY